MPASATSTPTSSRTQASVSTPASSLHSSSPSTNRLPAQPSAAGSAKRRVSGQVTTRKSLLAAGDEEVVEEGEWSRWSREALLEALKRERADNEEVRRRRFRFRLEQRGDDICARIA